MGGNHDNDLKRLLREAGCTFVRQAKVTMRFGTAP